MAGAYRKPSSPWDLFTTDLFLARPQKDASKLLRLDGLFVLQIPHNHPSN